MSISPRLAEQAGVVTDYDGSRPCIPPAVLARVAERSLLRVRVWRDECLEVCGGQTETAREAARPPGGDR